MANRRIARPSGVLSLVFGAVLGGCTSTSPEEGATPAASSSDAVNDARSVCPDCIAGGETTDFSGDVSCEATNVAVIERGSDVAREFGVEAVIARLEQPLHASFGWRRGRGGSVATGYERETEIDIDVEVLGLSYGEWRNLDDGGSCGDFVLLAATVQLGTADGALKGSFERPFRVQRNSEVAWLGALGIEDLPRAIDLASFTGRLDLKLDAERAHAGELGLSLAAGPDGVSGSLFLSIQYFDPDGNESTRLSPLGGSFPSNECAPEYVPIAPDAAINPADGRSARDYWASHRDSLDRAYPTAATWLDGTATEIDLELGELEGACLSGDGLQGFVSAPLQIRSVDGRITTTQTARASFRIDEDVTTPLRVDGEVSAREGLMAQVSAPGMDWARDYEGKFELYSRNPSAGAPSGDLQLIGFDGEGHNRLYLHWCSGADCSTFPRPKSLY